ncbi:tRNA (adenosine(37)-N6)-threonylcarbamoyltransferase complex dimerization subunit type 1 TsaB [Psychroflexus maritimus]|uniref:tRNA (Adenosine(37)-N6)-threonylcarbamoyltransferase complex dimerization subunit type 1 TsaB n=1 Tax=Psychroflexus maritimus TaxID=2714865 RepID=A0A967AI01_9FLAO|nr:tRNA (adenosine(37)-N6)-threonylcarbamoyltransferase complex dimerization subunit type 1 TsaB [Psychroflexus maritimus]NGZ89715.1 tRNA (adenosine(37)-N6)-threonylcarbamoyltransferase complex dimerization subunit type 1 TsaB [Psychroflexus maritimus]
MRAIKILGLETSTTNCSVALSINGRTEVIKEENSKNYSHAEKLNVFIDEVLKQSKLKVNDLDAVAVSKGPGSYTGLRIGVSSAKGLCFACNLPLISIPTLESLAHQIPTERLSQGDLILPMLDARRMEVYTQTYKSNLTAISKTEAKVLEEDSFEDLEATHLHFIGNGVEKFKKISNLKNVHFYTQEIPSANEMGKIAFKKFQNNEFEDVAYFEPFYLKDFIAGKPKKRFQ